MDLTKTFGTAWVGSGTLGFYGEGYWYQKYLRHFYRDALERTTFVAKTGTIDYNKGNAPLKPDFTLQELLPRCVWVDPWNNRALNSVGLSNPGYEALLARNLWQKRTDAFWLSFMPISRYQNPEDEFLLQQQETYRFTKMLKQALPSFIAFHSGKLGLQLNVSCPNVGVNSNKIVTRARVFLDTLEDLKIPIVVKINITVSADEALAIARHPACAGLCVSNTIPYGTPGTVDWKTLFGEISPLFLRNEDFGGGGLSGELIFPFVLSWLKEFRKVEARTRKPGGSSIYVNAGGGISSVADVRELRRAGANSISFATVVLTRPWRVPAIVDKAEELFRSRTSQETSSR